MRTTVAIDDHILDAAKRRARELDLTLGQLVEESLRRELVRGEEQREGPPVPVFEGRGGIKPGIDLTSNRAMQEFLDEGVPFEKLR